jgi:2'-5' RNA ligase
MRLFVGIGLPESIAQALAGAACRSVSLAPGSASRIRWTPPGSLHVTLSFLGQVEPARLEPIAAALAGVTASPLLLALDGLGLFADAGIAVAKVKPSPLLLALAGKVVAAMETCGIPPEKRPYQPHVTLARAKGRLPLRITRAEESAFTASFDATEFRLYQSQTLPQGAHYEILRAFPLK